MSKVIVVVANSCRARFFTNDSNTLLMEMDGMVHVKSGFKGHELTTDRNGRYLEAGKGCSHSTEPQVTAKQHEAHTFAKKVAEHIELNCQDDSYEKLYVIANPAFLGMVRPYLGPSAKRILGEQLAKDFTSMRPEQIRERLPYVL